MYLSLNTSAYYPGTPISTGFLYRQEQNPIQYIIHRRRHIDLIDIIDDSIRDEEYIKVVKPLLTVEYNHQYYLFIFDFGYNQGAYEGTKVYDVMQDFVNRNGLTALHFEHLEMFLVLSDVLLNDYDHENEALLNPDGSILDTDEVGGEIHFANL